MASSCWSAARRTTSPGEELRHEIAGSLHHSLLVRELDAARDCCADLDSARAANEDLSHIAMRDAMTGVFNRRGFLELGRDGDAHRASTHQPMSLIFADMDGLPSTMSMGEEGDLAICEAARLMQQLPPRRHRGTHRRRRVCRADAQWRGGRPSR